MAASHGIRHRIVVTQSGLAMLVGVVLAAAATAGGISGPSVGDVFAFGDVGSGRSCLGDAEGADVATRIDPTHLDGVQFVQVAAAHGSVLGFARHSLLVASDGRLFSCG